MNHPPLILDLTRQELTDDLGGKGYPAYRASQVWHWLYRRFSRQFDDMSNLPAGLRRELASDYTINPFISAQYRQSDDAIVKFLLQAEDGENIETVLIPSGRRRTVCVSSQAGCALGCAFCASAKGGFARDLSAGEMAGQVLAAARHGMERPTHVVFMGMGEPLLNYEALTRCLRMLNDPQGLSIAARRMTISTCGMVPGIKRLAQENMQFELSVSLHAPDDSLRGKLMPVNRRWPLAPLLDACREYAVKTGRIITFEYTMVAGLNDRPEQARQLVSLLRQIPCRVNLIPLSPIREFAGQAPPEEDIQRFRTIIRRGGINVTVRQSRGGGVDAACGQLRRQASANGKGTP